MDKITEQDLANRGVKGLPDVPGLTTEEMQRKLEEIAREILIPKVNELVEGLNNANSNLNVISGSITSNYSDNPISYEYNGFMAMIHINGLKNIEKNKQVTIATLPEGARPGGGRIVVDISNSDGAVVRLFIQASGDVIVYNYTDIDTTNIVQSFTYMK